MSTILRRKSAVPFQVKEVSATGEFTGYGSVFGVKDSYGDIVIKGAFAKSLEEWGKRGKLPKMLWQHRSAEPIGVYTKMFEDDKGLVVQGRILVEAGDLEKRAYVHMKEGSIDGLSIGYTIAPMGMEYDKGLDAYLLKQLDLWEVSPVTFPANGEATVSEVKEAIENGPREFERFLREAGLSRSQAKGLMARGFDGLRDLREAGDEDSSTDEVVKSLMKAIDALRGSARE